MRTTLHKGQKILIYENPITEHSSEGEATLIHLVKISRINFDYQLETWIVRFTGEERQVFRTIKRPYRIQK